MNDILDRPAYNRVEPCKSMCSKCGSADINRQFHAKDTVLPKPWGAEHRSSTEFVERTSFGNQAKKDCIVHHCCTCHYEWDGPCLS